MIDHRHVKDRLDEIVTSDPEMKRESSRSELIRIGLERGLEMRRKKFEAGDRMALMQAIADCAIARIPIPEWAATAYCTAFGRVARFEETSWDGALGKPYAGKKVKSVQDDQRRRLAVYLKVQGAKRLGRSLNTELFEEIAEEFGIGRTTAERLNSEGKRFLDEHVDEMNDFASSLAKS